MEYKYTHFIPQNTAPKGAKKIGVYNSKGEKVTSIALGGLTPPTSGKLYSFGLVSDIHLYKTDEYGNYPAWVDWFPNEKFENALSHFKNEGCAFCVVCGDLTQTGLYERTDESDPSTTYLDEAQFAKYEEICNKHKDNIEIYELAGNHECYYSQPLTNNLDKWATYTGRGVLSYTITKGNDLFIFCGEPNENDVMTEVDFKWLKETLANNQGERCFVFVHSYIEEDSGDPADKRENSIFETWSYKTAFINLLKSYPNVILFHGHSHMKFECQELDKKANYTDVNGFKSVHIPSLGRPRNLDLTPNISKPTPYADDEGQGYIVDVYEDCIVLNGLDLINNKPVPLGTYKIDTTLQTIEANTFTDSTGTIRT